MATSPLAQLIAKRPTYQPSAATKASIAGKTLVLIVGPTGVGKSSVIDLVVAKQPEFAVVNVVTTRDRKPEDPAKFQTGSDGFTFEKALSLVNTGNIVEYTINTNGHLYGQVVESFPATINLMACLPSGVGPLRAAGFGQTIVIYILSDGKDYHDRLVKSRTHYPDFEARLDEALHSFAFARTNKDTMHFVLNKTGEQDKAADDIIAIINGQHNNPPLEVEALLDDMTHAVEAIQGEL